MLTIYIYQKHATIYIYQKHANDLHISKPC